MIKENKMKKLAISLILMIFSIWAHAQLKYYDIAPDKSLVDGPVGSHDTINVLRPHDSARYYIDGAADIFISDGEAWLVTHDNVDVAVDLGEYPLALSSGSMINSGLHWSSGVTWSMLNDGAGNWINVVDKYIGVRVKKNGNYYYGWIRMDVDATPTFVKIKDYCVKTSPNSAISAGQMPTGFCEVTHGDVQVYISHSKLRLSNNDFSGLTKIRFVDMTGKTIDKYEFYGQEVSMATLPPGLYCLVIEYDGKMVIRKIHFAGS